MALLKANVDFDLFVDSERKAAAPAGKTGQPRPWTERSEENGLAPPAESIRL
ncbi:MAG: hypothetical protein ACE3JN_03120 [Ectobacillus sp.]